MSRVRGSSRFRFSLDSSFSSANSFSRRFSAASAAEPISAAQADACRCGIFNKPAYTPCRAYPFRGRLDGRSQPLSISAIEPDYARAEAHEMRSEIIHAGK